MERQQEPPLVLVIDDNPDDLTITSALLRHFGLAVIEADDGVAGLLAARSQPIDLAIVDMAMPGISGMDVGAAIRSDPQLAHLPLIGISAHVEYTELARRAGFDAVIAKPLIPEDFMRIVRSVLNPDEPTIETA
jgi:CheY-like chemotaxis protein